MVCDVFADRADGLWHTGSTQAFIVACERVGERGALTPEHTSLQPVAVKEPPGFTTPGAMASWPWYLLPPGAQVTDVAGIEMFTNPPAVTEKVVWKPCDV